MSAELAIEAHGLTKTFGKARAVDGVDLAVRAGGVYAILGPNGAGKTTTVRMLATLLPPDGGTARVLGHDVVADADRVRGRISLTGQFASLDQDLTARENLVLLGRLHGFRGREAQDRADELLDVFDLTDAAARPVKTYSGGMRRRADIAAGLVVAPDLMFLDEPTTGLDPRSRNQVWTIVRALVSTGTTVLLTTQYLDEADQLADRIAVVDHGRVIAEGTSGELKASVGSAALRLRLTDPADREHAHGLLAGQLGVPVRFGAEPGTLTAQVAGAAAEQAAVALASLSRDGIGVADFGLSHPSLDEVFLTLTGKPVEREEKVS
ncbi:ATP-binding cassette domain-containing protein [Amycolatopsis sp. OK19-0408]|uniref:ATP-binding cassette domain-containing protein n=1 Tax=Amycolatopsis iheyensis TaxID=2945988 RepID=A0A9X2N403_9PSEU|nr:ATP-binding cassette domain-containing protein [Amycolatopsis iheyensis]MCR6481906.1 ATP-binding cassette domain-containing protein [Amycolatopsis iheyensis]